MRIKDRVKVTAPEGTIHLGKYGTVKEMPGERKSFGRLGKGDEDEIVVIQLEGETGVRNFRRKHLKVLRK